MALGGMTPKQRLAIAVERLLLAPTRGIIFARCNAFGMAGTQIVSEGRLHYNYSFIYIFISIELFHLKLY
jgi:hypothetical protein